MARPSLFLARIAVLLSAGAILLDGTDIVTGGVLTKQVVALEQLRLPFSWVHRVLTDERRAWRVASEFNLRPLGPLGILAQEKQQDFCSGAILCWMTSSKSLDSGSVSVCTRNFSQRSMKLANGMRLIHDRSESKHTARSPEWRL